MNHSNANSAGYSMNRLGSLLPQVECPPRKPLTSQLEELQSKLHGLTIRIESIESVLGCSGPEVPVNTAPPPSIPTCVDSCLFNTERLIGKVERICQVLGV